MPCTDAMYNEATAGALQLHDLLLLPAEKPYVAEVVNPAARFDVQSKAVFHFHGGNSVATQPAPAWRLPNKPVGPSLSELDSKLETQWQPHKIIF